MLFGNHAIVVEGLTDAYGLSLEKGHGFTWPGRLKEYPDEYPPFVKGTQK